MQFKNFIFYLFIFSFPFTHAFAVTGTINLSVVLGSILFLLYLNRQKVNISTPHIILYMFLLNILLSVSVNINTINVKTVNHSIAWFTSILLFFVVPYSLFNESVIKKGYKALYISFYITVLFGFFEFLDVNILHLKIVNLIPRPSGESYDPLFIAGVRARSFFTESGYFGMFTALILPIILYAERGKLRNTNNLILLIFTAIVMFFTFSTTFFILLIFFLFSTFIFYKRKYFILRFLLSFFFVTIIYFLFKETIDNVLYLGILSKFSTASATSRESMNAASLNIMLKDSSLLHILFGYGPGSYDHLGIQAAISTYINLFRDLGLFGLLIFLTFYCYLLICMIKNNNLLNRYLFISIMSCLVYFQTNTSYYYAFIWFVTILVFKSKLIINYERQIKCHNCML